MRSKAVFIIVLLLVILALSGCNMLTVDKLYCLPKRPEVFSDLQSAIDEAMTGLEYSAPIAGEHQQSVQAADLTGDGVAEYLVFAKGTDEKPLQILIFTKSGGDFVLLDRINSTGTAFEQVEYIRMDERPGYELVIGRKVSDQVLRSVSVYSVFDQKLEQVLSVSCSKFLCGDLTNDGRLDLFILRPGEADTNDGIAELYTMKNGVVERRGEASMSESTANIKRMILGDLEDGPTAVFVASNISGSMLVTDVFTLVDGVFANICKTGSAETVVETQRDYNVYADDIDGDGILELPQLIPMKPADADSSAPESYLISWYSLTSQGQQVYKKNTYHNTIGGWYLDLDIISIQRIFVTPMGNSYDVCIWDENFSSYEKLYTVYVLTGQNREEQAVTANRFIVYRGEATIYSVKLEAVSAAYGITKDKMLRSFHLILQDWKTGVT